MQDYVSNPLFIQGEVQQLRKFLSDRIRDLEIYANLEKEDARFWKWEGKKEYSSYSWARYCTIRAKIKKLAALQVKLKSQDVLY